MVGSPDGKRIATGAYDGSLRVWNAAPGRELLTIPGHEGIVWNVAFSPDGSRLASASVDGFIRLWNSETGELLLTIPRGSSPCDGFTGLAFSADGSHLARVVKKGQQCCVVVDGQIGPLFDEMAPRWRPRFLSNGSVEYVARRGADYLRVRHVPAP